MSGYTCAYCSVWVNSGMAHWCRLEARQAEEANANAVLMATPVDDSLDRKMRLVLYRMDVLERENRNLTRTVRELEAGNGKAR